MTTLSTGFDEETARAEVYGLLAALFYAPPSPDLLAQLRVAVTDAPDKGGFLEAPWRELVAAARVADDLAIVREFDLLFGGVGKPEVYLFGSHYLTGFLNEKPLVKLRNDLAVLGLERDESMHETEDHFACLCEVMRYLIAGDDVTVANLTYQKAFFGDHLLPWSQQMCDAVSAHPAAKFYASVSAFARAFLVIEAQAFDMLV